MVVCGVHSTRIEVIESLERLIRRDRLWITVGLVLTISLAWLYLVREASAMNAMAAEGRRHAAMGMAGMNLRAWGGADWVALFAMWGVMMVAMMLPSAAPVILLVLGAYRLRSDAQARAAAVTFVGGYLLVWTAFIAIAASGQLALHRAAVLSEEMVLRSSAVSGVLLLLAGLYQWLPFQNRCLIRCQAPLAFLTQHWRPGVSGGLMMGLSHGAYCVGCCWLLMLLLFVLGVMNLVWVAALTVFVLIEKLATGGTIIARVGGVAAACWGIYLLTAG